MSTTQASQTLENAELNNSTLFNYLTCPACKHPQASIIESEKYASCSQCNAEFPLYKCGQQLIPWLYEDPKLNLLEWKARLSGFLHINQLEQHRLKEAQKDKRLSKTGKKRIDKILIAKKLQVTQVLDLLSPLNLDSQEELLNNPSKTLQSKIPKVQGLDSYYNNIFRDWSWDNGENEQLLEAIDSVLIKDQKLGDVLTIGSGAGRLSYDLHKKYQVNNSVLMDINPLLLFSACQAIQGNEFKLNEFPIAPLDKNSFVAEQHCRAPVAVNENIHYLFADGMNPPVKGKSFDTVVTPWLIDIIPQNLRDYISKINACLPIGGAWINTGSLAFFHQQQAWCYSEEEVLELVVKNGFEVVSSNRRPIQYLHSPLSAHGRTEYVFTFQARKVKDVATPPKYEYLPTWIRNITASIPKKYEQELDSSKHLLQAQVLGAIDGERSIEQIGELVAKQYNLQISEATNAVRQILVDFHESN